MTICLCSFAAKTPSDAEAIERLHERAFGPGRFARTAFRLREGAAARPDLCFTAHVGTYLVGSIRLSPVTMGDAPGLVLGPIAVEPAFTSRGIGFDLIAASLDAAREKGDRASFSSATNPIIAVRASRRCRKAASRFQAPSIRIGSCGSSSSRAPSTASRARSCRHRTLVIDRGCAVSGALPLLAVLAVLGLAPRISPAHPRL